ncbi:MAG: DUF2986 domain-containing protein [Pseudomonadales bacterium]|nr:DUF2986 domain-containing protein [Pseudomonadales bacterium]
MNRRKKINSILKKKAKRANAKLNPNKKPAYISKADRANLVENPEENQPENAASE